jgi:hypothetical protein
MISAEQQIIDFDGVITTADGKSLSATCKLILPDGTWQAAKIHIGLAQVERLPYLKTPLSLIGTDRNAREVQVNGIYYHSVYFELNRKTGLADMNIQLIGEIEIIHAVLSVPVKREFNISLSDAKFLKSMPAMSVVAKDHTRLEDLFTLTLPEIGKATFLRQWRFWRNMDDVTSKGACSFILELADASGVSNAISSRNPFLSALVVPSIFIRQRIAVNGWEERGVSIKEVIRLPLSPILPIDYSTSPAECLVDEFRLVKVMEQACTNFSNLSEKLKRIVEKMALGLVPFKHLNHEERFRAMFYGLESCRKLASKVPTAEIIKARDEVLAALKSSHQNLTGPAAERVQGFIQNVENGPKVDLRIELEEVLGKWKIATSDLWPLFGSDAEPGLVKIRDKLSHAGSSSVTDDSLVLATYHLSILIERIILAILDIPLSETLVSPEALQIDPWYARDRVLAARSGAFAKIA